MARKNPHIGSSFESWLEDTGIREEVTAAAIKAVIARQLASEMKKKKITKQRMAELMKTSRAQVDRLLDPDNGSATIESLQRAAKIVGRELRLSEFVAIRDILADRLVGKLVGDSTVVIARVLVHRLKGCHIVAEQPACLLIATKKTGNTAGKTALLVVLHLVDEQRGENDGGL